ncbi:hypothetical protein [Nitrosococcus oceani]|uniref:Uncharacterized protein n=2 Tax=Nitrosococcus oceani TaxID=1229 RepID=Q3J6W3_NITOC|nr:hypothetical protein [Nitrosococcus oceani]KFI18176.1 hypothetical protein IB75_15900 [Nitrosococcus oceani C-27]ABA59433.1 hypothetical protein Noc_2991 [Nitrosococcus oceani ATCC 19707]EDZ65697.1 hypothetical protein NOC27_2377 [Nitrosococcus oceani AFC27]KFI21369.1 hypothetical protein HW44_15560 [Nitrosococcus oceani]GEM19996.1 hypothetical protein NONS58_14000 [Nitrosococcus oceani]
MRLLWTATLSLFLLMMGLEVSSARVLITSIQGKILEADEKGGFAGTCVAIEGDYSELRVVGSEAGKAPRICIDRTRENVNAIEFRNVAFVATEASEEIRTVSFEHDFLSGPQGLVYSSVKLKGFFATATGVGVSTGNQIWFTGMFEQAGHDEIIGEELVQEVGESLDSALLSGETQDQFVLSGPRSLKGSLKFTLLKEGDKLILESGTAVVIDHIERRR